MDAEKLMLASSVADLYDRKTSELTPMCVGALKVLKLMSDGEWHTANELVAVVSAGSKRQLDGTRRVREIRKYGFTVIAEKKDEVWHYRVPLNSESEALEGEVIRCPVKHQVVVEVVLPKVQLSNLNADSMFVPSKTLVLDSSQYKVQ